MAKGSGKSAIIIGFDRREPKLRVLKCPTGNVNPSILEFIDYDESLFHNGKEQQILHDNISEIKEKAMGFEISPAMMKMLGGFTVLRAMNMAGSANVTVTKEQLLALNEKLNQIKK